MRRIVAALILAVLVAVGLSAQSAPAAPSGLTVTATSDGDAIAQWDRGDDSDTGIVLERAPDAAGAPGTFSPLPTLGSHENMYVDSSLDAATTYWYRVKATNASGSSSYSSSVSATTSAFSGDATMNIASITGTVDSAWQVTLSWTNPSDGSSSSPRFLVERSSNGGTTYDIILAQPSGTVGSTFTYVDTPLVPSTAYKYRVRKTNALTHSAFTYSGTLTTSAIGALPSLPAGLTASTTSATATSLTWTDTNAGAATYVVETAPMPGSGVFSAATWTQVAETSAGATSYALTTTANTPLFVRLKSKIGVNTSAYAKPIIVRPASTGTGGTVYQIGAGKTYATIGALDWSSLGPGDRVEIYPGTYHEKFAITRRGTAASPIQIVGIADASGNKPVIDGLSATTSSQFVISTTFEDLALIHVGKLSSDPIGHQAGYLTISGLVIQNGYGGNSPNTYTAASGASRTYDATGVAGIYIGRGDHVTIDNCTITGNNNGVFGAFNYDSNGYARAMSDITLSHNDIFGNGTLNGFSQHNTYLEGERVTYEYNHYGALRATASGAGIKDRGVGTIIRYNWLESGTARIDNVETQNAIPLFLTDKTYLKTYVYGNVIVSTPTDSIPYQVNYGGDSLSDDYSYRKGIMYFAYNTYVVRFNQSTAFRAILFRTKQDNGAHTMAFDVRNNAMVVKQDSGVQPELYLTEQYGRVWLGKNWITPGYFVAHTAGGTAGVTGTANLVNSTGNDPGFVDILNANYHPTATSQLLTNATTALPGGFPSAIDHEYVVTSSGQARAFASDLGFWQITGAPQPPGTPGSPNPADTATAISISTTLSWSATGATSYDVKFGTSPTPSTVSTAQAGSTYAPTVTYSTTYYWQIVANNAAGTTSGPVWSFTTAAQGVRVRLGRTLPHQ
jgi:hypothetical protein